MSRSCAILQVMQDAKVAGMAPSISVIIPGYRVAESIAATLDSVLAQTFRKYEITAVNDGSPDTEELEEVPAPYWERITYLRQENQGLSGARNTGIRPARGKYMVPSIDGRSPYYRQCTGSARNRQGVISLRGRRHLRAAGQAPVHGERICHVLPAGGVACLLAAGAGTPSLPRGPSVLRPHCHA